MNIVFYEKEDGTIPIVEFLGIADKMKSVRLA